MPREERVSSLYSRIELFKGYLRYEYVVAKNLDLFVSVEHYFKQDTRVRFGVNLDCWELFKVKVGIETQSLSARAYMGYP